MTKTSSNSEAQAQPAKQKQERNPIEAKDMETWRLRLLPQRHHDNDPELPTALQQGQCELLFAPIHTIFLVIILEMTRRKSIQLVANPFIHPPIADVASHKLREIKYIFLSNDFGVTQAVLAFR